MAVDVNKVITATFAVGSALAAIGGLLWNMQYPQVDPLMGVFPGASGYRDAFAFVILILILLFKPGGILGENVVEKV
jgi:branched-chain amino acid transport system permease protein